MSELPSLAKLALKDEPTRVPRGPNILIRGEEDAFFEGRRLRMTASMLPVWLRQHSGVSMKRPEFLDNVIRNNGIFQAMDPQRSSSCDKMQWQERPLTRWLLWGKEEEEARARQLYLHATKFQYSISSVQKRAPMPPPDGNDFTHLPASSEFTDRLNPKDFHYAMADSVSCTPDGTVC